MRGCTGLPLLTFIFLLLYSSRCQASPLNVIFSGDTSDLAAANLNVSGLDPLHAPSKIDPIFPDLAEHFSLEIREGTYNITELSAYICIIRALTHLAWYDSTSTTDPITFTYRDVRVIIQSSPYHSRQPIRFDLAALTLFQAAGYFVKMKPPCRSVVYIGKLDLVPEIEVLFAPLVMEEGKGMVEAERVNETQSGQPVPLAQMEEVYSISNDTSDLPEEADPTSMNASTSSPASVQTYKRSISNDTTSSISDLTDDNQEPAFSFPDTFTTTTTTTDNTSNPLAAPIPLDIQIQFLDTAPISPANFYYALAGALQAMAEIPRASICPSLSVVVTDCPVHASVTNNSPKRLTAAMVIKAVVKVTEESLRLQRWNRFRARVMDVSVLDSRGRGTEIGKVEVVRTRDAGGGRPSRPA